MSISNELLKKLIAVSQFSPVCIKTDVLIVNNTVKGLPNIPQEADYAIVTCESSNTTSIFARYSQSVDYVPSASNGIPLVDGQKFDILGKDAVNNFKIIATGSGTHKLWVEYFKM